MDVIQQVPKDARFLDEQCTSKDDGIIIVMENGSTVVQRKLHIRPPNWKVSCMSLTILKSQQWVLVRLEKLNQVLIGRGSPINEENFVNLP